jgi:uncharacterized protein YgiB involved in biofilm formation
MVTQTTRVTAYFIPRRKTALKRVTALSYAPMRNSAKTTFENELPKNMSQEDCSRQYGQCYYNNVGQSWTPVLAGFLLSQVVRENRDDKDTNTSTNTSSVGGEAAIARVQSGIPHQAIMPGVLTVKNPLTTAMA